MTKQMRSKLTVDLLDEEALRFTDLAKDISLQLLKAPDAPGAEVKRRLAQDHLIRAEAFKEAARIAAR